MTELYDSLSNVVPAGRAADNETDREFKAHIYQHLIEFQPFLASDTQMTVFVHQEQPEDIDENPEYVLTLVATMDEYRLETEGRDTNAYQAFSIAKTRMKMQLEEWLNFAVDQSERDAQIQSVIEGCQTLH